MNVLPEQTARKTFTLSQEQSSGRWGKNPEQKTLEEKLSAGIIILDKPPGPSSHEVTSWLKKVFGTKTGHSGTLDPPVSGVLPIGIGLGTRALTALKDANKEYVCLMRLEKPAETEKTKQVLSEFTGKIYQTPPQLSAVKKQLRARKIHYIQILEQDPQHVLFKIGCEAGTYVRTLCQDVGKAIGTPAEMQELRRTQVALFSETQAHSIHDVVDAYEFYRGGEPKPLDGMLLPIEAAAAHLPCVYLRDTCVDAVCHGADVARPGIAKIQTGMARGKTVAIKTLQNELVGIGTALYTSKEISELSKGIAVKTQNVYMRPGTYPRTWRKATEKGLNKPGQSNN